MFVSHSRGVPTPLFSPLNPCVIGYSVDPWGGGARQKIIARREELKHEPRQEEKQDAGEEEASGFS